MARLPLVALLAAVAACGVAAENSNADGYKATDQKPPWVGVEMSPPTLAAQAANNLQMDQGVLVRQVYPNTAAQNMGVQPNDVILEVNGTPITSMTDLRNEVGFNTVGDPLDLTVVRNGQRVAMHGTFGEWPANVPREPLDPAVEQRFKDWQRRHLERNQHEVSELRQQLDDLKRALADQQQAEAAGAPRPDGALDETAAMLKALPAWKLGVRYALDADDVAAAGGAPVVVEPVGGEAWRLDYRLDSTVQR